jgi:hypothetical protein
MSNKYSPTLQLISRAQDFACLLSEELRPRVPDFLPDKSVAGEGDFRLRVDERPPDGFLGTDRRCSVNVINKIIRTSSGYSPSSKAAPSLPESSPAFLLQALIPHPGFNGHKPTSFLEGEGRLDKSVVNRISTQNIRMEGSRAPDPAAAPLQPAILPAPAERSHVRMELVLWAQPMGLRQAVIERCSGSTDIVSTRDEELGGSYLVPELSPAHHHALSGLKLDRRLRWKPPNLKELRRHSVDVVSLRNNGMSRLYSPGLKTGLVPFTLPPDSQSPLLGLEPDRRLHSEPFDAEMRERCSEPMIIVSTSDGVMEGSYLTPEPVPARRCSLSGLRPNRRLLWKPPDMEKLKQRPIHVVRSRNGGMSRSYSPGAETALMPSNPLLGLFTLLSGWKRFWNHS